MHQLHFATSCGAVSPPEELALYLFDGELWHFVGGRQLVPQAIPQQGLPQVPARGVAWRSVSSLSLNPPVEVAVRSSGLSLYRGRIWGVEYSTRAYSIWWWRSAPSTGG